MNVLICGSRDWSDPDPIRERISTLPPGSRVIHGGCRGADQIAGDLAEQMGLEVSCFPANWSEHGRSAGPRRNQQMLVEGSPDIVLAFHEDIESSRGTRDMITRARKAGIPVEIIGRRSE